jgi:hypothetical protein
MTTLAQLREAMTPGPWGRDGSDRHHFGVRGAPPGGVVLAVVRDGDRGPYGKWEDAAVIALVPELVAVAEAAEAFIDQRYEDLGERADLKDAVKALRARLEKQ